MDGDTVHAYLDLGFKTFAKEVFRLAGINAPELHAPTKTAGELAKTYVEDWVNYHGPDATWPFIIVSTAQDKYGRWLGDIYAASDTSITLNQILLNEGLAVPYL